MKLVLAASGRPYDLVFICALTGLVVLLSIAQVSSNLTSLLAFICIFFTPGYALISAMFPAKSAKFGKLFRNDEGEQSEISLLERVIASIALSLLVFAFGGILLAWSPLGLDKTIALAEVLVFNIAFSALAIYRRFQLPKDQEFNLAIELGATKKEGKLSAVEKVILGVVVVTVLIAILAGAGLLWPGIGLEPHTEFYIAGADGSLGTLPQNLAVGADGIILVTFINHMGEATDYNITIGVMAPDAITNQSLLDWNKNLVLQPGDLYYYETTLSEGLGFAKSLRFSFASVGSYKIVFQLDDSQQVQELWLWVNVG